MGGLLQLTLRMLEFLQRATPRRKARHLHTGRKGETAAYLLLRKQGYRIVATNFRTPHNRGEIDVIAWDGEVLCFVEVKTRIGEGLTPPEAAVDSAKKDHIRSVAREYLRRLSGQRNPHCRFDIVSVRFADEHAKPKIRLIKGAFRWKTYTPRPQSTFERSPRVKSWKPLR